MLCQKCQKKEASVYYKESINGVTKTMALCPDCAEEARQSGSLNFNIGSAGLFGDNNMDSLFASLFSPKTQKSAKSDHVKKCTLCGATFAELMREGKTGCPDCYAVFEEELRPTVSRIHGNVTHTGRAPKKRKAQRATADKLRCLKQDLENAIKAEAFENAAKIRDEIRALEYQSGEQK